MILGLTGAARSGKDTVANFLDKNLRGIKRVQIAGPLKAFCREVFDWTEAHTDGDLKDVPDPRYPRTCRWCDGRGADTHDHAGRPLGTPEECPQCKGEKVTYLTPREAMQRLGHDWSAPLYESIWAEKAARTAGMYSTAGVPAVVTDCRFVRDIKAVKGAGGIIVQVHRDGEGLNLALASLHQSEVERMSEAFQQLVDHHIYNDGTLDDLALKVRDLCEQLRDLRPRLYPGCWMESARFGEAVLIEPRPDHDLIRYKARHLPTGKNLWVIALTTDARFKALPDARSQAILKLEGEMPFEPEVV